MRRIRFARILCPIDFSPRSKPAFEQACAIAREDHAELRLLYVMEPGDAPFTARLDGAMHQSVMDRVRSFLKDAGCQDIRPAAAIREGQAAREILRLASRLRADLIVIGAGVGRECNGSSVGLGHVARAVSSVAHAVAANATCPVLIAHDAPRQTGRVASPKDVEVAMA